MPSRREQIRMAPEEIRSYLETQRKIVVVTIGSEGWPHAVPMNYGVDAGGNILITTFRKSQKVKNLERDPRATLLVESGESYHEFKSVMAYCNAEIIDDAERVGELMRLVRARGTVAASLSASMNEQIRSSYAKRVVVRFSPVRIISWDHAKLGEFY